MLLHQRSEPLKDAKNAHRVRQYPKRFAALRVIIEASLLCAFSRHEILCIPRGDSPDLRHSCVHTELLNDQNGYLNEGNTCTDVRPRLDLGTSFPDRITDSGTPLRRP